MSIKNKIYRGRAKGQRNLERKRIVSVHGYIEVFEPKHPCAKKNGYVLEHRMVAWDAGLITDKTMNVHHKNEDKTDNRLKNLEVISHAEHVSRHWKGVQRSASGEPCAKCPTLTRSQYGLCTKHYRQWWDKCHRRKVSSHGAI